MARTIDVRIKRALKYIQTHFHEKILANKLAKESGLSVQHLRYLFKREIGTRVKDHLRNLRIRRAKELLKKPHITITEISIGLGYSDLKNFNRDFKRITHQAPRDYRKQFARTPRKSGA